MKGERRWTQGGIWQIRAPRGRARRTKRFLQTKSFLEIRFGILLGLQAGGKTDRSDIRSPSVSPLSSTCLTLRRTCAQNAQQATIADIRTCSACKVRCMAYRHIVGAGTEGPARGRGWWDARLAVSSVLVGRLTKLDETADGREVRRSLTATADRPPPLSGGYNTKLTIQRHQPPII